MKKLGINFFIFMTLCTLLSSCVFKSDRYPTTKKSEFLAMLLDPEIRKGYRELKKEAEQAQLYQKDGRTYIAAEDIKKLNAISAVLTNRLQYHYHLNPSQYRPHTYIGKNAYDSCYQYYNSLAPRQVGKSCGEFSRSFSSCDLCNKFIKKLRSPHSLRIVHMEKTTVLTEIIKLRNGDSAYVGLELSTGE
jgi:hypothetical protein